MLVLGIESSCDDTAVAVYDAERGLLSHAIHSQTLTHQRYGGVVPELASRDHSAHLVPLVEEAFTQAGIVAAELDAVAYTAGPGLIGALLVGSCFAKSMALSLSIPSLAVHHLEAHVLAARLACPDLEYPFIALLVSGGHCQLVMVENQGNYQILGETLDDAVGEAFDKTAKLMGMPYPGGPLLAAMADQCTNTTYHFPRPMTDRPGLDFSFSGLKTHVLTTWQQSDQSEASKQAIARAFQEAVVDTLLIKCKRAVAATGCQRLVVAGGVGANRSLRQHLANWIVGQGGEIYFPDLAFCTDNGAMVAYAGCLRLLRGECDVDGAILVRPRWPLDELV